jgi:drug/metabolite transporter (DMT)-like permease
MTRFPLKIALSYLTVYIVWGSTYLFIKMGVETMPPFYLVGIRFFLGGVAFLAIGALTGKLRGLPTRQELLSALFLGIVLLVLGNGLVSVAERTVDSYLAALVVAATPFCVALFNRVLFREKLPHYRLAGMLCGLAGVALILYNGKNILSSVTPGVGVVIGGLASWSLATSVGHSMKVHSNTLVNSGLQMTFGGAVALVIAAIAYGPVVPLVAAISPRSWIGCIYLTVLGAAGFYCYSYLIKHEPSIRVVSYAIVNPLIAVVLGLLFAKEKPAPLLGVGFPLILASLALMLYGGEIMRRIAMKRGRDGSDAYPALPKFGKRP